MLDFYTMFPSPVSIKEPESGKYVFANASCLALLGLTSADPMLGLTVRQLDCIQWCPAPDGVQHVIRQDRLACERQVPVDALQTFFNAHDKLICGSASKYIIAEDGKAGAPYLITQFYDFGPDISTESLYLLYRKFCSVQSAISKCLRHLALDTCFDMLPTEAELWVLLAHSRGASSDLIADLHDVSVQQIDHLVHTVHRKIRPGMREIVQAGLCIRPQHDKFRLPFAEGDRTISLDAA